MLMNRIGYCCIPMGCNVGKKKKEQIQVKKISRETLFMIIKKMLRVTLFLEK